MPPSAPPPPSLVPRANSAPPARPPPPAKARGSHSGGGGPRSSLSLSSSSRGVYGMLRKTRQRTYTALRGGRKNQNHVAGNNHRRAGESEAGEYSSSDSIAGDALNFGGRRSMGVQAANQSPFVMFRNAGGGGAGVVEPARSFYFNPPQSIWAHGGGGLQRRKTTDGVIGNIFSPQPQQQQQQQPGTNADAMEDIVRSVESCLRQVVLCCAMFIAGTMMPQRVSLARHVLELSSAAWGTCLLIVALGWFQSRQLQRRAAQQTNNFMAVAPPPVTPMIGNLAGNSTSPSVPLRDERLQTRASADNNAQEMFKFSNNETTGKSLSPPRTDIGKKRSHDDLITELPEDSTKPPSTKIMRGNQKPTAASKHQRQQTQQNLHPQLDNVYVVMMVGKRERVFPNSIPCDIDNDLMSGKMLIMIRTKDVDEPTTLSPSSDPVVDYFRGKQRRFEFQWQFRLKKLPQGDVFMGAELEEPIHMGMIQRALSNTALKFVKKMNQGFTYFLSDSLESGPSYLSFPVGTSMDRFNASKPGEALPVLGNEVFEDAELMKQRKKGTKIVWDTEVVYTMALWSAYFDWIDWQILNFPGIRPFSATSVAGMQPIKMTLFTNNDEDIDKREVVFAMEVSNAAKSTLGSEAKKWIEEEEAVAITKKSALEAISEPLGSSEIDSGESEEEDDEEDMEYQSETHGDACNTEDLEEDDEAEGMDEMLDNIDTGCYLLSGSSVSLREGTGNYVSSGGGYAVLQSSPTSYIVLEKIQSKKKKQKAGVSPSMMIRSGDVVRVKLVEVSSKAVKYLTLHRGWWLRWVARPKRNNGLFHIRTADEPNGRGRLVVLGSPFSLVSRRWSHYSIGACISPSLKYGGRMLGIYKAGKKSMDYESMVGDGVGEEDDGGPAMQDSRMMPLLLCAENFGGLSTALENRLNFSPEDYLSPAKSPNRIARQISAEDAKSLPMLELSENEHLQYRIDVPAWLEVMDRTKRTIQLVYAVRVEETALIQNVNELEDSEIEAGNRSGSLSTKRQFVKLRTGRDLAPILRLGVEYKRELSPTDPWQQRFDFSNRELTYTNEADSSSSESDDSSDEELEDEPSHFLIAGPNHSDDVNETFATDNGNDFAKVFPGEDLLPNSEVGQESDAIEDMENPNCSGNQTQNNHRNAQPQHCRSLSDNSLVATKVKREKSIESDNADNAEYIRRGNSMPKGGAKLSSHTSADMVGQEPPASPETKRKSRAKYTVIGRVGKTIKASTVVTGKHVIKHSKNIGKGTVKGTVSAGRAAGRVGAALPAAVVYNYKPPKRHEPGGRVKNRKRTDKGEKKMIGRAIKNIEGQGNFSAQLLAQDQSRKKVSRILADLSKTPYLSTPVLDAISSLATKNSPQDLAFLHGSSAELGIKPLQPVDAGFDIDCVVARCVYSGFWREELCVLYSQKFHLAFYAPLAKKPSLVVSFEEIMSARKCGDESQQPLPGFHLLSIDTAWKCHYLAFEENTGRENFLKRLNDALFYADRQPQQSLKGGQAQEYESYRMSLETSLTGTAGKWRAVSISKNNKQKKQRRVLNGRRCEFFDLAPVTENETAAKSDAQEKVAVYVEELLRTALSFSAEALDATDSRFIEFLDETSRLRTLPLHAIDLSSKGALCIFVNLYHCLLQHSLLLAVDGLPNKRSVIHFKRCSCYEIGEDIFSLAELECCVIRGKSRASHIKPPFVGAAKKSRAYRMMYGLGLTDHRVNFVLNNGDMAYPSAVPVLQPQSMDEQMDAAASCFLADQVKIDKRKRTVFLPKVCDVYGMGDGLVSLSQCLVYLSEEEQLAIASLLDNGVVSVKFNRNCDEFHANLTELT